jgi:hypothetical protein
MPQAFIKMARLLMWQAQVRNSTLWTTSWLEIAGAQTVFWAFGNGKS